jgi:hypothetical protein
MECHLIDMEIFGFHSISYNVSREPYADLIASQTAERRAADLVSNDIGMVLAAYFARPAPAPTT